MESSLCRKPLLGLERFRKIDVKISCLNRKLPTCQQNLHMQVVWLGKIELCNDQKRESPSRQTLSHIAHMSAAEGII